MESNVEGQSGFTSSVGQETEVSAWGVGFITFASLLLIMMGGFHAFTGFVAVIDDAFFVQPREYLTDFSQSAWGWAHIVAGTIAVVTGFGILTGAMWARILGVGVALLSALVNFAFIPYYPVWSIIMIAVSVGVMWALVAHGRDMQEV